MIKNQPRTLKPIWRDLCCVAPAPDVAESMRHEAERAAAAIGVGGFTLRMTDARPKARHLPRGFNDSAIYPPDHIAEVSFSLGVVPESPLLARRVSPPPPQGEIHIVVLMVDFADRPFQDADALRADLQNMLFSTGIYPTGSLNDYYREASGGKTWFNGTVAGPYRAPQPNAFYTDGRSGTGAYPNNVPRLVEDVAALADPDVDFSRFDPNGDGYVDGLVVVHAGPGAESVTDATQRANTIWSHKWTTSTRKVYDNTNLYAYLTVPEQSTIGVWAHELGHLIFGWPDLYDVDNSSEGLGNYCLMSTGSWNGPTRGTRPAHPCAWCKIKQNWVTVQVPAHDQTIIVQPVETEHEVFKLWAEGHPEQEYFLLENRQPLGFDDHLPDHGLAIYHVDERQEDNSQESRYMVGLEQADGENDLENAENRGDAGDLWPEGDQVAFDALSTPDSNAYNGALSFVSVREITQDGQNIRASLNVGVPNPEPPPEPPPEPGEDAEPIPTSGCATAILQLMRLLGWLE